MCHTYGPRCSALIVFACVYADLTELHRSPLRLARLQVLSTHPASLVLVLSLIVQQGHRTYTSFLHFLACVTLLASYIAGVCISAVYYAFLNPLNIVSTTDFSASHDYLTSDRTTIRPCMKCP